VVEHLTFNQGVDGSIPSGLANFKPILIGLALFWLVGLAVFVGRAFRIVQLRSTIWTRDWAAVAPLPADDLLGSKRMIAISAGAAAFGTTRDI
jgi:hypothetical protein